MHKFNVILLLIDGARVDRISKFPIFQKFRHPIYRQFHGKFVPEMSIIDLLFNEGRDGAKEILQNSVVKTLHEKNKK